MASPLPEKIEAYLEGQVSGQVVVGNQNTVIHAAAGAVVTVAERTEAPRLRPLPVLLRPRPFPGLLDREREIGAANAALAAGLPLDLHGAPGLGKTSLLRHLAHRAPHSSLPDGVVHLAARGLTREDLQQALFEAFWETDAPFRPETVWLRHALQQRRALVLLDDVDVPREEIEALLDLAPGSVFVLASGERRLWGEMRAVALAGLPVEAALELIERELERPLAPEERSAAERLATALEGHPLRVLQAAARVREERLSLAEMERQAASTTATARLLAEANSRSEPERRILAALAAAGSGALRAATLEALTEISGASPLIEGLTARRLVEPHGQGFRLSGDLGRVLEEAWDLSAWRERTAERFGAAPDRPVPEVPPDEVDAVRGILARSLADGQFADTVRLARSIEGVFFRAVRWGSWVLVLQAALRAAEALQDRASEAWCLHQLGTRALVLGDAEFARRALSQALRLRESLGAELEAAITRHNLGLLGAAIQEPEEPPALQARKSAAPPRRLASTFRGLLAALVLLLIGLGAWRLWPRPGVEGPGKAGGTAEPAGPGTELQPADGETTPLSGGEITPTPSEQTPPPGGETTPAAVEPTPRPGRDTSPTPGDETPHPHLETPPPPGGQTSPTPVPEETPPPNPGGTGTAGHLEIDPAALDFGMTRLGSRETRGLGLRNTGSAPVEAGEITIDDKAFALLDNRCSRRSLGPGERCTIQIGFAPEKEGGYRGAVQIRHDATGPQSAALEGRGAAPHARVEPKEIDFGTGDLGSRWKPRTVQVMSVGDWPLEVRSVSLSPREAPFRLADSCQGRTLKTKESCAATLSFLPRSSGDFKATLQIEHSGDGRPYLVPLSGSATMPREPGVRWQPEVLDFGKLELKGKEVQNRVFVSSVGSAPLRVEKIQIDAKASGFGLVKESCTGRELEPKDGCDIVVRFLPEHPGENSGELRFETSAAGSPHGVKLHAWVEQRKVIETPPAGSGSDLRPRDTEPPPIPGGLKPGNDSPKTPEPVECSRLVLAWKPVQDAGGPVRYEVELRRRDDKTGAWEGVGKWESASPSLSIQKYVRAGLTYAWRIRARDAADNVSDPSRPVFLTCTVSGPPALKERSR